MMLSRKIIVRKATLQTTNKFFEALLIFLLSDKTSVLHAVYKGMYGS